MDKHYDPKKIEDKWYQAWLDNDVFHGKSEDGGEPYCVVIPPPNVTGILHMGHALNNTIQDISCRWRRMQGRNVAWIPGTDHAGIATQNVVERALKAEGKTRDDLGREAFLERVWEWKEQYGSTITNQLKKLGASCDWERERFTMDEGLSDSVAEVFCKLYDKSLIYRGSRIVNWCPRCHTALSDEESEHQDKVGKLYHPRYPVQGGKEGEYIVVATTRPETMLGDVAVAVHPEDARYADLDQKTILLPILNRELKVVRDDYVDPAFGTGIVKITPAHDPNDFELGQRHDLEQIDVMNGDGTMNDLAGPYAGMDRFACRKQLLKDLEAAGLLEKIDDHNHAVGHCYRCDTVVEPRLSPQWFVKMAPLAEPALKAVQEGQIEFVPARWENVYNGWMTNIRDWCISRQIWWGHRIPVFYCDGCNHEWAQKGMPTACPACSTADIRQDEDVLDTWFSSWLWPFSTFGWPEQNDDLKFYYPTHDLVTASEIIFFWVARMVMAGIEFMDEIPFRRVYIHGTVRDDQGRKMSKSLGNSIDPLDIIEKYSADALRFSLIMLTATGQDVYISDEKFELGRNFGTKIWNAARFIQMNSANWDGARGQAEIDPALLASDDRHILGKLAEATAAVDENLERFRFNDAAKVLYDFVWHHFCDWYVEYAKDALNGDDEPRRAQVLSILHFVLNSSLKLLHPIMPFLTEELWHAMGYGAEGDYIMSETWPGIEGELTPESWGVDAASVDYVEKKRELIRAGRLLRADHNIAPTQRIDYLIKPVDAATTEALRTDLPSLVNGLRAASITIDPALQPDGTTPSGLSPLGSIYLPIEGLIDVEAERTKLQKELGQLQGQIKGAEAKLGNENYTSRAPAEVVQKTRELLVEHQQKHEKLEALLAALKA
jgi:valyl-tRNA synthetase